MTQNLPSSDLDPDARRSPKSRVKAATPIHTISVAKSLLNDKKWKTNKRCTTRQTSFVILKEAVMQSCKLKCLTFTIKLEVTIYYYDRKVSSWSLTIFTEILKKRIRNIIIRKVILFIENLLPSSHGLNQKSKQAKQMLMILKKASTAPSSTQMFYSVVSKLSKLKPSEAEKEETLFFVNVLNNTFQCVCHQKLSRNNKDNDCNFFLSKIT